MHKPHKKSVSLLVGSIINNVQGTLLAAGNSADGPIRHRPRHPTAQSITPLRPMAQSVTTRAVRRPTAQSVTARAI